MQHEQTQEPEVVEPANNSYRNNPDALTSAPPRRTFETPVGVRVRMKRPGEAPIDHCSGCGAVISIYPPIPDRPVKTWLCNTCGSVYFGSDGDPASELGVRQAANSAFVSEVMVAVDSRTNSVTPSHVRRLVQSLGGKPFTGPERRRDQRYAIAVPAVAVPLGNDFRIIGEPVQMTTMNVSLGGAALIHTRFTDTPYYALDFTAAGVQLLQVVLQVMRVRNVGPVYEVAGRFISRLSQRD